MFQGKFGNFFNENINSTIKEIGWKSSIFLYFKLFHSAYNLKKLFWNGTKLSVNIKKTKKTIFFMEDCVPSIT